MLTVEKRIISRNFTRAGAGRKIEYIVIHYFGSLGTAAAVANYFAGADRQASAHYCLDEGNIVYQCVEDNNIAWHCLSLIHISEPTRLLRSRMPSSA